MILGIRTHDKSAAGFTATSSTIGTRRDSFNCVSDSLDERWRDEELECWIASDASAVVEHTKRVIVMEDNDVLHITGGGYGIYNTAQVNTLGRKSPETLNLCFYIHTLKLSGTNS